MSDSEIMTILVPFHTHRFRDLKSFYLNYSCWHMRGAFPHPLSYNHFVEFQVQVTLHLLLFLQKYALGRCSDISQNLFKMLFVDNIHLVTKIKKAIENSLISLYLRRYYSESVPH